MIIKYILLLILMLYPAVCFAQDDYDALYESAELCKTKLFNDVDPFQDEDMIKYAWSPYPLFRTASYMYFKELAVEPGYYSLTPRNLGGKDYVLFKQNGKVQYIIPVVKKESTPINFYEANTPKMKLTPTQKFVAAVRHKFYNTAKDSLRSTPPNSLVSVEADTKYLVIVLFYGDDKYTLLFKRTPY